MFYGCHLLRYKYVASVQYITVSTRFRVYVTQGAERELWRMSKADVAGSDAKGSCNASWSQSQASTAQGLGSAPSASQQSQLTTGQQSIIDGGLMQPPSNIDIGDAEGFQKAGCVGEKEEVMFGDCNQYSSLSHAIIRNAGHMVRSQLYLKVALPTSSLT